MTSETGTSDVLDNSPEARYVNDFAVGFNALEVVLDFAQSYGTASPPPTVRLVMSPVYAKEFMTMLTAAIAEFERTFGTLQDR